MFLSVDYESLQEYKKVKEDHITLPEVVSILGVNRMVILKLYDMGVLNGFEKKKNKTTMQILFNKKSVFNFLEQFERQLKIEQEVEPPNKIINFNGCVHSWGCMQRSFRELVKKILSGEISPIGKGKGTGLQCYLFSKNDLEKVIKNELLLYSKDEYSIKEVCFILKTDQKTLSKWIEAGFIKVNRVSKKDVRVSKEELENFVDQYITLPEIARRLNENSKKLINTIKKMDIRILITPFHKGGGYLFYREELESKLNKPIDENL
jgi:hypothetical protein